MTFKKNLIKLGSTNPDLQPHIREILAAADPADQAFGLMSDWKGLENALDGHTQKLISEIKDVLKQADSLHKMGVYNEDAGLLAGYPLKELQKFSHFLSQVEKQILDIKQKSSRHAHVLTAADTFKCPTCGTKVLEQTGYCVKCKKKVKKAAAIRYNWNDEDLTFTQVAAKAKAKAVEMIGNKMKYHLLMDSAKPGNLQVSVLQAQEYQGRNIRFHA